MMMDRRRFLMTAGALAAASHARKAAFAESWQGTLRIGMANNVMTPIYPYIYNANEFGFFEDAGLRVEVIMGQGTPQILSLLVSGTVDLAFCNPEPMMRLNVERSMDLRSIIAVQQSQYVIAVPSGSDIQGIEELRGKRLGMFSPESGIDYLRARLLDVGMTVDDLQIVPTAFGGQTIAAVQNDDVDAVMYWTDALTIFRQGGLELRELPKADWEEGLYQYVGVAKNQLIDEKEEELEAAVRAMARALMFSVVDPVATAEAFWRQYPDQEPNAESREQALAENVARVKEYNKILGLPAEPTQEQIMRHTFGEQYEDAWVRLQHNLARTGAIEETIAPSSYFDNRFLKKANDFDRSEIYQLAEEY